MTLEQLSQWLSSAPPGTLLDAGTVAECLARPESTLAPRSTVTAPEPPTWQEKLWTAPAETRLGVQELSEALSRPRSWIYRHTSEKSGLSLLPHRKLDGELVFVVSEIRNWIQRNEQTIVAGRAPLHLARSGAA